MRPCPQTAPTTWPVGQLGGQRQSPFFQAAQAGHQNSTFSSLLKMPIRYEGRRFCQADGPGQGPTVHPEQARWGRVSPMLPQLSQQPLQ